MADRFTFGTLEQRVIDQHWRNLSEELDSFAGCLTYPRQNASGNLSVTTTTATLIPGCSLSITPSISGLIRVDAWIDVSIIAWTNLTSLLVVELHVNGVAQAVTMPWIGTVANDRQTHPGGWTFACTAGTAYTVELKARQGGTANNTYQVRTTSTGFIAQVVRTP